jgi:uncharacterized protein YjdB
VDATNGAMTATCAVTVTTSLPETVYVGGQFGMVLNGAAQAAYDGSTVHAVEIVDGVVHACGSHGNDAVFWQNGARQTLPRAAGTLRAEALGMFIDGADVYVCGYEASGAQQSPRYRAKLWVNGVDVPVHEPDDCVFSIATGVVRHNGVTYWCGGIETPDYYCQPGYSDDVGRPAFALWSSGSTYINRMESGNYGSYMASSIAVAPDGLLWVGCAAIGVLSYDLWNDDIPSHSGFPITYGGVFSIKNIGGTMFSAGYSRDPYYPPCYWVGDSRVDLPADLAAGSEWAEAQDIVFAQDGLVHVCGRELLENGSYAPKLWTGDAPQSVPGWTAASGAAYAITGPAGTPVAVSGVSLDRSSLDLTAGGAYGTIVATIAPADATNKSVTWESSDHAVASFRISGLSATVIPRSPGTATITATTWDGGKTASCDVTVTVTQYAIPVTGVSLDSASFFFNDTATTEIYTANIAPTDATCKNVWWSWSDPSVAIVSADGLTATVTPLSVGTVQIDVYTEDGGFRATCFVVVGDYSGGPVTGVSLSPTTMSLTIGGADQSLAATVAPANASNRNVSWASSNPSVATVSGNGGNGLTATVHPVSIGEATITVTTADGGFQAQCGVAVPVVVSPRIAELAPGGTRAFTANTAVAWTITSGSITGDGLYTAPAAAGTYTVTAISLEHPSMSGTATVAVAPPGERAVYVAGAVRDYGLYGNLDYHAALWRNGVRLWASDAASYAESVFVSGNDVYVAGYTQTDGTWQSTRATLWKNGDPSLLPSLLDDDYSYASSVFISGSDVYVGGRANSGATLWTNGVPQMLPHGLYGNASSVFVSGGDVYVAGDGSGNSSWLWKNGEPSPLLGNYSYANSVFVSGADVYVGGTAYDLNDLDYWDRKNAVWKNGELTLLPTGDSAGDHESWYAEKCSVFVHGGDVYATAGEWEHFGGDDYNRDKRAIVWKNGTRQQLMSDFGSVSESIFVHGGDVYVAGHEGDSPYRAVIWKNGVRQLLSDWDFESALAHSVFVK